jgi:S-adenosylmethionine:tRNA ribosyltransferase-isomerase
MKTRDFFFNLDKERIAQYPIEKREASRLLVLDKSEQKFYDACFSDFPDLLKPGSVLVINDSKVRKARVFGFNTETGGKTEFLFLSEISPGTWKVMTSKSGRKRAGQTYVFGDGVTGEIRSKEGNVSILRLSRPVDGDFFERSGHIPLPPYIRRKDELLDEARYQTVYSQETGSAAAPTAGLHFTEEILLRIKARGIEIAPVTLHVGPATFLPIRTENIEDHIMYEEEYYISESSASIINRALEDRRDIIAVGTTVVRTLESAYCRGSITSGKNTTSLYIYPGYRFKAISGLLTNFHTPQSSLLVLVSAFAGIEFIASAYRHAIGDKYRFFSYGDAMFIR